MANLNPEGAFSSLKERVKAAVTQQFPYTGQKHKLELVSVRVQDSANNPSSQFHLDNIQSQYDAKTKGRTWAVPIRAELRLIDLESGDVLDTSTITLARLPKITRRYSYIIDGHERQHDSVFRLKSRPYHLIADNGVIRAYWNVAKGHGFDLHIDPRSGLMKMKLGTSNVSLYQVLKVLGISDMQMENAWGPEVLKFNREKARPEEVLKIHKVLSRRAKGAEAPTVAEAEEFTRKAFDETRLRPDAMEAAFGTPSDRVNGDNLLLSSKRILSISRGTGKEDDRQSLSAKDIASTDDFIVEAIERRTGDLRRRIYNNIDRKTSIREIISPNAYTKIIKGVFAHSQLPDQTNPLQFVSGHLRTTLRGSEFGGVKGEHSALDRDQLINPSHLGFLDPVQTPESEDTGIALHLPLHVRKEGKELKIDVYDVKQRKWVPATPGKLESAVVAYPDQVKWVGKKPVPISDEVVVYDENRDTSKRPWRDVDYVLRSSRGLFSFSANMIPFLQNNNGSRAMMGAKQQEQAVSLRDREAPLVQTKSESKLSFERIMGIFNSHQSRVNGVVVRVQPGVITIKSDGGQVSEEQIYNHYPLNGGKNMLHAEPTVKVGDRVKKGQTIADTNYTKGGELALGSNLRVAYTPYHGLNFEDGIVISESASEKMTSLHMHAESATVFPGMLVDKERWKDYSLPEKATAERMAKLGDDGVVKEGEQVVPGDILIALLGPAPKTKETEILASIHKKHLVRDFRDRAVTWEHDYTGTVSKVIRAGKKITVHVRTSEKLSVGDKLSGRHGNKGIVSRIIADKDMPHDKDGNAVHVLLNPAGVPSRINVGQVLETAASKIAKKTGKAYVVENFKSGVDYTQQVKSALKAAGLNEDGTEELFDAKTGKSLGQIMTGDQYMLKLHHMVDKKMSARSHGGAYTSKGQPPSGSGIPGGGQKMDMLTTYSMLAHGANANLREAYTYKSDQDQDEVWIAVQTGRPLPDPKPTRGMGQFLALMKGMGVHAEKKGDKYLLSPMTDKQTRAMSNGKVKFPNKALMAKGVRTIEEAGGLFDPKTTGGIDGKFWTHIDLQKRVPNPMFEKAILLLTGMKKPDFEELIGPGGMRGKKSGFEVIADLLRNIDVDTELEKTEKSLAKLKGSPLNKAYRKVRYLRALKKHGITPLEAYTNNSLPVLPPAIRRVSIGLDGKQIFDDLNGLYLAVGQANEAIKRADRSTPKSEIQRMEAGLYDAIRALRISGMDMGEGSKARHHFGLMEKMKGPAQPKQSFFQDGVLSRRQDLSGRSTIIPAPEMGLDEVGLPTPIAMEMYKPFVVKELFKNRGFSPLQAQKMIKKKDPVALEALRRVVADRPVLMKRDPALHKFSIMAFNPRLTAGKAIAIHPLVTGGFNADFDGDTMALYVPVSDEAVDEAKKKMLPSKNLFSPTHGGIMPVPGQDSLLGLYQMTAWGKPSLKATGATPERILVLLDANKIKSADVVSYKGKKTTAGRLALASVLPLAMKNDRRILYDKTFRLSKGPLKKFLAEVARRYPDEFPKMVDAWKDFGNKYSYLNGSSFSLNDFHDGHKFRKEVLKPYEKEETAIRRSRMSREKKDEAISDLYIKASAELRTRGEERYGAGGKENKIYDWVSSGAKGNWAQFSQMVFGAMIVVDAKNKAVPVPIKKSFGEGLSVAEYWASLHGARKGTLDRAKGTQEPGALTKDLINTAISYQVTSDDCGTTKGIAVDPRDSSADAADRFLAKPVTLKGGQTIQAKTLLDSMTLTRIRNSGVKKIIVRSPLHCRQAKGICATCYGKNERGRNYSLGTNVGIIAGHALGEPVTQMTMRTFHTGGVAGEEGVTDYFKRAKQIFFVPKTLPGSATLTTVSGTISRVAPNIALGGFDVVVGIKTFRIPAQLKPLPHIKQGAVVKKGDALSTGPLNPHHMLEQTGNIHAVRGYMTDELMKVYPGGTRRRNVETVIRAMTNLTKIDSAPSHPEYIRGQSVPLSEIEHHNRLASQAGMPTIHHTPRLRPMTQVPLDGQEDWMARLNYRKLKETFEEGAAQGWSSDIHGHPIAGLAHGAEFGIKMPKGVDMPAPTIATIPKAPKPFTPKPFKTKKPEDSSTRFKDFFRRLKR